MLYITGLRHAAKYFIGVGIIVGILIPGLGFSSLSGSLSEEAIADRIQPYGREKISGVDPQAATKKTVAGPDKIYQSNCALCHKGGLAGAPKYGDKSAWATRLKKGKDTLYNNAIKGIGAMPPMGNCLSCSEDDIRDTIDWMLKKSS